MALGRGIGQPAAAACGMSRLSAPRLGIALILIGVTLISVNDMLIKELSDRFALHQIVFLRSAIAIWVAFALLRVEGGFHLLKTRRPGLHALRALLIVAANLTFFAAIAVMPLGLATAVFFVAPLFITLLSIPVLGETVGPRRLIAVGVGFAGVLVMVETKGATDVPLWTFLLPVFAALFYAGMQVLTRKLGEGSAASAMSVYIHIAFLATSALVFLAAGDGRWLPYVENESLQFLLRPWIWPAPEQWARIVAIGVMGGFIGYALSQAYRSADAGLIAPFEYVALPMAIFWGWLIFGEEPGLRLWIGSAMIAGSGIFVLLREARLKS
jgi:S-adenosylmethionine uptake transporter